MARRSTTRQNRVVVIENTQPQAAETPAQDAVQEGGVQRLRVTAVSSSGKRSTRNAPAGIKEPGDIFAVEITRTNLPEWRINWYHATKAEAVKETKALVGRVGKGKSGAVVAARVIAAEAYYVQLPS